MLIPIRLFTLPSPLRAAPLLEGASVRKNCTDASGLYPSWKTWIPVFDTVSSPVIALYRGQMYVFSFTR